MSTHDDGTLVPKNWDSPPNSFSLPHLSTTQRYSLRIENWVVQELEKRGYNVHQPPNFFQKGCDAVVNGLCVQVMAAKRTKRKKVTRAGEIKESWRYQWFLHSVPQGEFILILVADTPQKKRFCFIVPGSQVGSRQHLQLTSHPLKYSGWLAEYLEKWSVIDYLSQEVYKGHGPMFPEWERERVAA